MPVTPAEINDKANRAAQHNRAAYRWQLRAQSQGKCRRCRQPAYVSPAGKRSPYCIRCRARVRARRQGQPEDAAAVAASTAPVYDIIAVTRQSLAQIHAAAIALGMCPVCGGYMGNLARFAGATQCGGADCAPVGGGG